MEKSKKQFSRILNHEAEKDYYRLFVTLTYSNDYVPYICLSDLDVSTGDDFENDLNPSPIEIRRRYETYEVKNRYGTRRYRRPLSSPIAAPSLSAAERKKYFKSLYIDELKSLQEFPIPFCVGVLWHDDFTRFIKRFCIYIKRYYNIDLHHEHRFFYYKIGEYGPTTFRPHFHALLYFPSDFAKYYYALKRAIIKAWPFCSPDEWKTNIKVAYSGQKYVSMYAVRPTYYPQFFKINRFSQKPTYSRGFGYGRSAFLPSSIYGCIAAKVFTYSYSVVDENGAYSSHTAGVPSYVYRRYFPKFKGFCHLTSSEIFSVLANPYRIFDYRERLGYTSQDFITFHRQYYRATGYYPYGVFNAIDYALHYTTLYNYLPLYQESVMLNTVENIYQFYDNNLDVINHRVRIIYEPSCGDMFNPTRLVADPNTFSYRVAQAAQLNQEYEEFRKKSKINDIAYNGNVRVNTYCFQPKLQSYG